MALLPSPSALIELTRYAVGQVFETAAAVATVPARAMSLLGQAELLVTRITVIADSAEALVDQLATIVTDAQESVRTVQAVAATAALTVQEAATITTGAARLMDEAGAVTTGAARLVDEAGAVTAGAVGVLDGAGRAADAAGVVLVDATAATEAAGVVLANAAAATDAATAVVARAEAAAAEATRLLTAYAPTLDKAAPLAARFVDDLTPDEVTSAIKMVDELPRLREHLVNDVMPLLGKLDQVGPDLHNLLEVTQDLHLAIVGLPGLKMLRRRGEERVAEDEDRSRRP